MKKYFTAVILLFSIIAITIIYPQKEYAAVTTSATLSTLADARRPAPDSRVKILSDYLRQYNSPLTGYAPVLVREADANGIDWRLLTAISGVESTYAQAIPYDSYNAWGWGIYGDQTKYFNSWEDAITTISKGLRENFISKLKTDDVYAIGRWYAASPTWAVRVEANMNRIDRFANNNTDTLSLSL